MGVKGLKSFIENSSDVLKPRSFRDSKLIIDGCNLQSILYYSANLDYKHGGDYEGFEKVITQFVCNLRTCGIEAYVVFDGGDATNDKKFPTKIERSKSRIRDAYSASQGGTVKVMPCFVKTVFVQVLRKLAVPFVKCLGEADPEIAALANEWNCPVLSNDSDFYIFNLRRGFLPISYFQWKKVKIIRGKPCIFTKQFRFLNLCTAYKNLNKYHLPLFATILGNDFIKLDEELFPNWARFSDRPGRVAKLDGLLNWLSQFPSPKEAINNLQSLMDRTKFFSLRKEIYQNMQEYRLGPSSIVQFFLNAEPQSRPPGPLQNLPDWMLMPIAESRLGSDIINVMMMQRVRFGFKVEDFQLRSSNQVSQSIRQVMYGVLLRTRRQAVNRYTPPAAQGPRFEVVEYDREKLELICSSVPAVLPAEAESHLSLETLWETPHQLRLQVLLDALCVSLLPNVLLVPPNLQLAVYVTCFWMKNAEPEPTAETFWALLIGLVYGELRRKHPSETETQTILLKLKRPQRVLDLGLAHAYSQWQRCMKDTYILNQFLDTPIPEPQISWLFCGSLLHRVAHELQRGVEPESLLAGTLLGVDLYQKLQAAVERELDADYISRLRVRSGPSTRPPQDDELSLLIKQLMAEEEDGDGDKIYEETCSARTRHKSRAHTHDPRAKKHERVRWQ